MMRRFFELLFGKKKVDDVHAAKKYHELTIGPNARKFLVLGKEKEKDWSVRFGDKTSENIVAMSSMENCPFNFKTADFYDQDDGEDDDDPITGGNGFQIFPI